MKTELYLLISISIVSILGVVSFFKFLKSDFAKKVYDYEEQTIEDFKHIFDRVV